MFSVHGDDLTLLNVRTTHPSAGGKGHPPHSLLMSVHDSVAPSHGGGCVVIHLT